MVRDIAIRRYLKENNTRGGLAVGQVRGASARIGFFHLWRGWLETSMWLPITEDKHTFLDFSQLYARSKYEGFFSEDFERRLDAAPAQSLERLFVLGGEPNHWHLLMDFIPRLYGFAVLPQIRDYPVLIDAALSGDQRNLVSTCLERVGIETPKLVTVPRHEIRRVRDIWTTSRIDRRSAALIWENHLLRGRRDGQGPERIFVMRGETVRYRRLLNQDDIRSLLEPHGFVAIEPGELTIDEQIEAFSSARLIVGVHGAGLTNLLFAPAGGQCLELYTGIRQHFFADLAAVKRIAYHALEGSAAGDNPARTDNADFTIDKARLMAVLAPMLEADKKRGTAAK